MVKRTSIKDIAEKLGVSNATVSLVLNNRLEGGRVSKELAEKIRLEAKEMNYHPNGVARSLQSGRSYTIGLIVADISNPFFGTLALHIQEEAERHGYSVVIVNTNEDDMRMGKMIGMLQKRQVDGYIIVPTESGVVHIRSLLERRTPLVLVDRCFPSLRASCVIIDNYSASSEITELLIKKGCRNVALLIYKSTLSNMLERKQGYVDKLKEHDLYDPDLVYEVDYTDLQHDIDRKIKEMLTYKDIDAIYFATNTIAISGVKVLKKYCSGFPDRIKLVCFDKNEAFDFVNKLVAYVRQPIANMGRKAVVTLLEQMEQKEDEVDLIMCKLSATLIG